MQKEIKGFSLNRVGQKDNKDTDISDILSRKKDNPSGNEMRERKILREKILIAKPDNKHYSFCFNETFKVYKYTQLNWDVLMLSSITIRSGLFNILIEALTSFGLRCMVDFLKYSQNERKRRYLFLALFVDRILNIEYIYIYILSDNKKSLFFNRNFVHRL